MQQQDAVGDGSKQLHSLSGVAGCKVGSTGVDSVTGTWGSVETSVGVLRTARR